MDTLCENKVPDTSFTLFGKTFRYPFFAGPVGAVDLHYGDKHSDLTYNDMVLKACAENGIAAFTGDGTNPETVIQASKGIAQVNALGIPTIKPWKYLRRLSMCGTGSLQEITRDMVRI